MSALEHESYLRQVIRTLNRRIWISEGNRTFIKVQLRRCVVEPERAVIQFGRFDGLTTFEERLEALGAMAFSDWNSLSKLARDEFGQFVAEMIERGDSIPAGARMYASKLMRSNAKMSKATFKAGRSKLDLLARDYFLICVLMNIAETRFVRVTRNREQDSVDSACSILSRILVSEGIPISEAGLAEIWRRYAVGMVPKSGCASVR